MYAYTNITFPGGSEGKESACNTGDPGSIPGREDPLEKEMATHFSILAWRIPWIEEPGGLHSPWGRKELDTTEGAEHAGIRRSIRICLLFSSFFSLSIL